MEVYIDYMLTKSKIVADYIKDSSRTFDQLEKYQMELNHTNCVFGVQEGIFLGFIINQKGI